MHHEAVLHPVSMQKKANSLFLHLAITPPKFALNKQQVSQPGVTLPGKVQQLRNRTKLSIILPVIR